MFIKGNIYRDQYYYCDIILNVGTIKCGKEQIDDVHNSNQTVLYLNQVMFLMKNTNDDVYKLHVEGPDGNSFFSIDTDLSKREFKDIIKYFIELNDDDNL